MSSRSTSTPREPHGRADQCRARFRCLLVKGLKLGLLALVRLGLDRVPPFTIIFAFERRRDSKTQIFDEAFHV